MRRRPSWTTTIHGRTRTGTGAQYFYRVGQKKTLYCNKAAVGWPQSCNSNTTTTCPGGGTLIQPVSQPQTCGGVTSATSTSTKTTCTAQTTTYSPAGCDTLPAASVASPVGTCVGIECLACNSTTTCTASTTTTTTTTTRSGTCSLSGKSCSCTGATCTPTCSNYTPPGAVATCSNGATPTQTTTTTCSTCSGSGNGCDCGDFLKGSVTTTLQDDADLLNGGTGLTCRHNNQPGYAAGLFTYPSGVYTTKVTSGCPSVQQTVQIPRNYYTVDAVTFCNSTNTTVNAQWKGFGAGTCQSKNDLTTYVNVKYGQMKRVDLVNDGRTFAYVDRVTGSAATRTYAEEMTNYANWYAYYRTRILAAKTVSSIAFSYLDNTYRVGFHTFGSPAVGSSSVLWVDPLDFNLAQKTAWYSKLFGISITNYMTPTLDAMLRIGNLFQTGTNGAQPNVTPLPAPVKDPIQLSCQSNYHILFTDGYANQALLPTVGRKRRQRRADVHRGRQSAGQRAADAASARGQSVAEAFP